MTALRVLLIRLAISVDVSFSLFHIVWMLVNSLRFIVLLSRCGHAFPYAPTFETCFSATMGLGFDTHGYSYPAMKKMNAATVTKYQYGSS